MASDWLETGPVALQESTMTALVPGVSIRLP
jgi:hypothetical protein